MKPEQLKAIRLGLGYGSNPSGFASALGYGGSKATHEAMVYNWESGRRPIPKIIEARLAWLNAKRSLE